MVVGVSLRKDPASPFIDGRGGQIYIGSARKVISSEGKRMWSSRCQCTWSCSLQCFYRGGPVLLSIRGTPYVGDYKSLPHPVVYMVSIGRSCSSPFRVVPLLGRVLVLLCLVKIYSFVLLQTSGEAESFRGPRVSRRFPSGGAEGDSPEVSPVSSGESPTRVRP